MEEVFTANKQLNAQEMRQKKTKLDSFMTSLIVTLSSRCNLGCIMCEVRRTNWEIPLNVVEQIASLFPYLETINWQGGEPFFLDYFENLFTRAAAFKNIKQTIVTNGLLITEGWAEKLVNNNVELTFSIDGVTKEVYEHIRRGAEFNNVIRNVKMINQIRKNNPSSRITTRLHVVIMKSNYMQLEEFVDFAKEYEFQALHLMPVLGKVTAVENIFSLPDKRILGQISSVRKIIEEKARRYNLLLLDALPFYSSDAPHQTDGSIGRHQDITQPSCYLPWQQLNIDPGGGVRPGCLCLKTIGNVLENNLRDLWNSESMHSYRKKIIEKDFQSLCEPACLAVQISQQRKKAGI